MQQGWIEWAKVCKLTILHDLATFTWGSDHNYVPCGYCYDEGSLFYLLCSSDVKWTMPQFKFCFHLESKMSAAAPASSLPWSGPSPHCMRFRRTPPLPPPFFVPLLQLITFLQTNPFSHCFFLPFPMPFFYMISFNLRWFALCERYVCLRIFPPIECC